MQTTWSIYTKGIDFITVQRLNRVQNLQVQKLPCFRHRVRTDGTVCTPFLRWISATDCGEWLDRRLWMKINATKQTHDWHVSRLCHALTPVSFVSTGDK